MGTYQAKKNEVERRWYLIDLEDQVLGRAATLIASILRGKNKPQFTPHTDAGDFVVAINASKIKMTGNKAAQKEYHWHSGYPGGLKTISFERLLAKQPQAIMKAAVKGMLPKNILGRGLLKKLKVYPAGQHPHAAQKPETLKLS